MSTVLLIEDEPALGMIVSDSLQVRGFNVIHAMNGCEGLAMFSEFNPDIVVADVMMPEMDGFTLASHIRKFNSETPIMFLTSRSQTADVVKGFELGGNDYLKKPFSLDELVVRIHALLRRKPVMAEAAPSVFQIGRYQFDPAKQKLVLEGRDFLLSHRESELLRRLYEQRNQVLERNAVLLELWGDDSFFNGRSLDVFITKLRRHLKDDPQIQIINIRGIGYKLIV
ncbi:response regulator transcription factor [Dyadobacter sp. LJ53]|uniref:response regulator transcription factor n=1 Tax=Dyadobacter chenwenxiniae TaxID=2906456 RepID=UPI001F2145B5|nr:response regulator transcription factor [Dyadobacter chenwenxiniae]MCF0051743.1 response regulator transcription factor [Dyadobacter chenwenxiniae]